MATAYVAPFFRRINAFYQRAARFRSEISAATVKSPPRINGSALVCFNSDTCRERKTFRRRHCFKQKRRNIVPDRFFLRAHLTPFLISDWRLIFICTMLGQKKLSDLLHSLLLCFIRFS